MSAPVRRATPSHVFSHWFKMIDGLKFSPTEFYSSVETHLQKHAIPDLKILQVTCKEGGVLSANRLYLRIIRKGKIFDICGAPFGSGFFVSWWLGDKPPTSLQKFLTLLSYIPFLGAMFQNGSDSTYYQIDTMLMFQQAVHSAVSEAVDEVVEAQGLRPLTELEKQPNMNI